LEHPALHASIDTLGGVSEVDMPAYLIHYLYQRPRGAIQTRPHEKVRSHPEPDFVRPQDLNAIIGKIRRWDTWGGSYSAPQHELNLSATRE
jgi:hypothetical protein